MTIILSSINAKSKKNIFLKTSKITSKLSKSTFSPEEEEGEEDSA